MARPASFGTNIDCLFAGDNRMCNSMKHKSTPLERKALAISDAAFLALLACGATAIIAYASGDPTAGRIAALLAIGCVPVIFVAGRVASLEGGWPGRLVLLAVAGVVFSVAAFTHSFRRLFDRH